MAKEIDTKAPVTKYNKATQEHITKGDGGLFSVTKMVDGRFVEMLVKPNTRQTARNPNPEGIKICAEKRGQTVAEYLAKPVAPKVRKPATPKKDPKLAKKKEDPKIKGRQGK